MSSALAGMGDSVRAQADRVMHLVNKVCHATVAGLALSIATSATWAQVPAVRPAATPAAAMQPAKTKAATTKAADAKGSASAKPADKSGVKPMDTSLQGEWRIARGVLAPWLPATDRGWDTKSWVGQTMRFEPNRVTGPGSLKCAGVVNYEATRYGADALFQGGLPTPATRADSAVKDLGFAKMPAKGTSLNCDAGLFEFHQLDTMAELVAVNNVIWTLDRSPGALSAATSPSGVVQRFLEAHFAGDMWFDTATFAPKRKFFSKPVQSLTKKYFAKPVDADAVPDIDGDPFTDSQEYPTRFSVSLATINGNSATVPVRFSDAYEIRKVTYVLTMEAGAWKVDDVRYKDIPTFRQLLTGNFPK